ncbi:TorF family putative porin [Solimonas soli]|uniref:TorF family putative porin n=1 Tax=Solimonas soli TaxID=413479 RepID=UPI0004B4108F|nr:TorF family putative porin [Solimonas soli]
MEFKRSVVSAVLIGAAAFSGSAMAGVTGNVGAVSEYFFRGLAQDSVITGRSDGKPAIQGGIDYAHDSGFYAGIWGSNVSWGAGGSETDLYLGYSTKIADTFGIDVGAIYYAYFDYKGDANDAADTDPNTVEGYIKLSYGPIALQYYYSPSYFGTSPAYAGSNPADNDEVKNSYIALIGTFPLSDSLNFIVSVGDTISSEDVWITKSDGSYKDSYIDYNVGLSKAIDETLSVGFSIIGTTLKRADDPSKSDGPNFVVSAKKTFAL